MTKERARANKNAPETARLKKGKGFNFLSKIKGKKFFQSLLVIRMEGFGCRRRNRSHRRNAIAHKITEQIRSDTWILFFASCAAHESLAKRIWCYAFLSQAVASFISLKEC
jgi:hypothetical protein